MWTKRVSGSFNEKQQLSQQIRNLLELERISVEIDSDANMIVFALFALLSFAEANLEGRIVGGTEAAKGQFPWHAQICRIIEEEPGCR